MRKLTTLQLGNSDSATIALTRGTLKIPRGKKCRGVGFRMSIPVRNATGGTLATGLSSAQKTALLNCFQFTANWGSRGQRRLFNAVGGERVHIEFRDAYMSETEGYNDTTTGLNRSMTNAADTTLVLHLVMPTGMHSALGDGNILGMGPSQAQTFECEIRRTSKQLIPGTPDTLYINGVVNIDVFPDTVSARDDVMSALPEYLEIPALSSREVVFPQGLPLRIGERTYAQLSSTLTSYDVMCDDEYLHFQITPGDMLIELGDQWQLPAAGLISDVETVLWKPKFGTPFGDLPSGTPRFIQNVANIATPAMNYLYVPVIAFDELADEIGAAAKVKGKALRAVSYLAARNVPAPTRLAFATPFGLYDERDAEYSMYPGLWSNGQRAKILAPNGVQATAQQQFQLHARRGELPAAGRVLKNFAAAVPGAVNSGRGITENSPVLREIVGYFPR